MKKILSVIILIFPNMFWGGLAILLDVNRININIDYFLPLVLYLKGWKKSSLFIYGVVSFFDFINLFSQIFPFIRFFDFIYLIKFSFLSSLINFLIPLLFLIFSYIYYKLLSSIIITKIQLLYFLLIILFLFIFQNVSSTEISIRPWSIKSDKIIYSQILNTYDVRGSGFLESFDAKGGAFENIELNSASNELFNNIEHDKVLLILNESWGVAVDDEININIMEDVIFNDSLKNHNVSLMSVNGFTINGEIRELCRKSLKHFNLKNQITGFEKCLPNIYKNKGYSTYAMHAATGSMYDRRYWYSRAGFEKTIFREDVVDLKSRCYSFPGFCDRDLLFNITEAFKKQKVLFYWLTLNSHVNYDLRDLKLDLFDCEKFGILSDSASCRNLKLQKQFFYYLGEMLEKPQMKGVYIIIVGDHAPPMYGESKKDFREDMVPILKLEVK